MTGILAQNHVLRRFDLDRPVFRQLLIRMQSRNLDIESPKDFLGIRGPALAPIHREEPQVGQNPALADDSGLAADHDPLSQLRASRDADLGDNHRIGADHHIVGDLDEVVDLHPFLDPGPSEGPAVDRRIGAYLNVVIDLDVAGLGGLYICPAGIGKSEAVTADDDAGMQDDPLVGRTLGPYRIDRKIGEGGMGKVWLAEHLWLARPVAIKLLRADLTGSARTVERFRREAGAASRIGNPHIVEVLDMGAAAGGEPFLAMELLLSKMTKTKTNADFLAAMRAHMNL